MLISISAALRTLHVLNSREPLLHTEIFAWIAGLLPTRLLFNNFSQKILYACIIIPLWCQFCQHAYADIPHIISAYTFCHATLLWCVFMQAGPQLTVTEHKANMRQMVSGLGISETLARFVARVRPTAHKKAMQKYGLTVVILSYVCRRVTCPVNSSTRSMTFKMMPNASSYLKWNVQCLAIINLTAPLTAALQHVSKKKRKQNNN